MAQPSHRGVRNPVSLLEETPVEEEGNAAERVAGVHRRGSLTRREKPGLSEEDLG